MPFIITLLILVGGGHSRAASPSHSARIARLLDRQEIIRVGVDWGPGMGHQSAGAAVYYQLRALGYEGEVEVIYDNSRPEMPAKMGAVFRMFDPSGSAEQRSKARKIWFIPEDVFDQRTGPSDRILLSLMGADDQQRTPAIYNSEVLITLQPMNWHEPSTIQVQRASGHGLYADVSYLNELPFYFDTWATPAALHGEEAKGLRPRAPLVRKQVRGLRAVFDRLDGIDVAPYYGHGLYKNLEQLQQYVSAIVEAKRRDPALFRKPVLVLILMELTGARRRELDSLLTTFRGVDRRMQIESADFRRELDLLEPSQVVLIEVGALPRDIFEYWLAQSSLAPMVGGRNSINLLGLAGRPYLPSNAREFFHFLEAQMAEETFPDFVEELNFLLKVSKAIFNVDLTPAGVDLLADFFAATRRSEAGLNAFFRLQKIAIGPYGDKVSKGLLAYLRQSTPVARAALTKKGQYIRPRTAEGTCQTDLER